MFYSDAIVFVVIFRHYFEGLGEDIAPWTRADNLLGLFWCSGDVFEESTVCEVIRGDCFTSRDFVIFSLCATSETFLTTR